MLLAELAAHPSIERVGARAFSARYSTIPEEGRIQVDFQTPLSEPLLHCSCNTDDDAFMRDVAARYPELSFLRVSDLDLYDVNPGDATKLNGVKTLAEHFNIPLSQVVAFGDDFNDIEMLSHCGVGIAMSNAIPECKAVADQICGDCDDDGVARWIEGNLL